jgi:hypothetical protein
VSKVNEGKVEPQAAVPRLRDFMRRYETFKSIVFQGEEYEIMAYCTLEATLGDIRDKAS